MNIETSLKNEPHEFNERYEVTNADGTPTDPDAIYFVLRLDSGCRDPEHLQACRSAARAYIRETTWGDAETSHLETIGSDLKTLLNKLESEAV